MLIVYFDWCIFPPGLIVTKCSESELIRKCCMCEVISECAVLQLKNKTKQKNPCTLPLPAEHIGQYVHVLRSVRVLTRACAVAFEAGVVEKDML